MQTFTSIEEENRFLDCLINDEYETILVVWGVDHLFSVLKWYQFIGNEAAADKVIRCIEDHLDREFQKLSSGE